MSKDILILALESSCDETACAVVKNGREVLSSVIYSQIPIHQKFGGVVPEIASRHHVGQILPVLEQALAEAQVSLERLDAVAVTYGPGLVGALLVGVAAAKGLAFALDKPLVGVNHLQGHVYANFIAYPELEPPFVSLVVSGGHTSLLHVPDYATFTLLGQTLDDAAGEAFDKIARLLQLSYPGGPEIEKLAQAGNPQAIKFPQALKGETFNFSFSGLKSAVLNYVHNAKQKGLELNYAHVAASFQESVVESLCDKTMHALAYTKENKLVLAGGVSANKKLREKLEKKVSSLGAKLYYPPLALCTDNAAMIGCRAFYLFKQGKMSNLALNAKPALSLVQD